MRAGVGCAACSPASTASTPMCSRSSLRSGLRRSAVSRSALATVMGGIADAGIALLFFLYGGRLPRQVIVSWLDAMAFAAAGVRRTFALSPAARPRALCCLSPVDAGGAARRPRLPVRAPFDGPIVDRVHLHRSRNIPAAICSATVSNLIGRPPHTASRCVSSCSGEGTAPRARSRRVQEIVLFFLAPFVVGHRSGRSSAAGWNGTNRGSATSTAVSILFVVYIAFSEGVVGGIWHQLPPVSLALLVLISAVLLGAVICILTFAARRLGFGEEDEIVIVFCGSKKSLASGLPMAKLLFAGPMVGMLVLPLMLFHQLQLMVCAALARRYAKRREASAATAIGA